MSDSIIADVLAALDILVLEQVEDHDFRVIGHLPSWFKDICPQEVIADQEIQPGTMFSFLDNFLVDATQFWLGDNVGLLKSGLWSETNPEGQEIHLEASALNLADKNILLLKSSKTDYDALFSLVQTARERVLESISERKQATETMMKATFYDPLTGLPNQTYFIIQLMYALQRAKQDSSYHFAVLILSLDRLQVINNSLGRLIGDQLLISTAGRLQDGLGPSDIVACLGGDEFIMLLDDISNTNHILLIANRLLADLRQPFKFSGQDVIITASIGIAASTLVYDQAEDLLRDANTAMHHAKALGGGRYVTFEPAMHAQAVKLLQLEMICNEPFGSRSCNPTISPLFHFRVTRLQDLKC